MQITFDTNALSDLDLRILTAIFEVDTTPGTKAATKPAAKKAAAAPPPADAEPEATDDGEATMEQAVALATKLVSNGEAATVKKALGDLGAKRVSELKADDIATFVASLS